MVAARSSDTEMRLPKVLSIGDAKSLYMITCALGYRVVQTTDVQQLTFKSSGAACMDAQDATVRWVDHSGMYADAMTKRNGNVPLPQILM